MRALAENDRHEARAPRLHVEHRPASVAQGQPRSYFAITNLGPLDYDSVTVEVEAVPGEGRSYAFRNEPAPLICDDGLGQETHRLDFGPWKRHGVLIAPTPAYESGNGILVLSVATAEGESWTCRKRFDLSKAEVRFI